MSYAYDDEDKLTSKTSTLNGATVKTETFGYSYHDRQASYLRQDTTGAPVTEAMMQYGFLPEGDRIFKEDLFGPGGQEWYLYGPGSDIIADYAVTGTSYTMTAAYVDGAGIDKKLLKLDYPGASERWYVADALGSTHQMLDAGQNVDHTYIYDAWGNVLDQLGSLATATNFQQERPGRSCFFFAHFIPTKHS